MCVGDFGEGGDEGRMDDVFVDYIGDNTEGGYGGYRKHLGTVHLYSSSIQLRGEIGKEMEMENSSTT